MNKRSMVKIILLIDLVLFGYVGSYIWFRQNHIETWERNKTEYVIFPENKILYYVYRPVSMIDGALTGMQFHIGPHQ